MADEFTPTMENLVSAYAWAATDDDAEHRAADARRAIAAHDRTERAAAWDEGYDSGVYEGGKTVDGWGLNSGHDTEAERDNPYRIERGE